MYQVMLIPQVFNCVNFLFLFFFRLNTSVVDLSALNQFSGKLVTLPPPQGVRTRPTRHRRRSKCLKAFLVRDPKRPVKGVYTATCSYRAAGRKRCSHQVSEKLMCSEHFNAMKKRKISHVDPMFVPGLGFILAPTSFRG